MKEAHEQPQSPREKPFALHFPSLAGEVLTPASKLTASEEKEEEFFKLRGIEREEPLMDSTTTSSTISTPSTTSHDTTSQTAKEVRTGIGGWDKSMEVGTDHQDDGQLDKSDDEGAADD